ncbi:MAG TPA: TonB-dependent receptor [Flavipsychrobacter sp.]|nr:TonB-dependent receptor [Flavipsychrobacter sp.]
MQQFFIRGIALIAFSIILAPQRAFAQAQDTALDSKQLLSLSLEELMNIEIHSVSKRPEKLSEAASAIQVITQEDIKRSGATNLPEALRLAPNLQVAQVNSHAWLISARGFDAIFSNKLLVLIDGRNIYSPLFAGVSWDAQNVLLEDVDRIEVISGPGATLWGANAVNGVVNIITKDANSTQGFYMSESVGSLYKYSASARYGGKIGSKLAYRVYGMRNSYDTTYIKDKAGKDISQNDEAEITQLGFRIDYTPSEKSNVMVLGNFYVGKENARPEKSGIDGQNITGRWTRTFSPNSELVVQAFVDRTWKRDIPSLISEELYTYDIDLQHRFPIGKRHSLLWGAGYRFMRDEVISSTTFVGIVPNLRNMDVVNAFVQDEVMLWKDRLKLSFGSKVQHNVFTGFEVQPDARLAFMPNETNTVWAAVSRAVRTPSRFDKDYFLPFYPVPDSVPSVQGGPDFISETLIAYELGYRVRPCRNLSLSLATFFNSYDNLYSVEAVPGTQTYHIQNGGEGHSVGLELSGNYQPFEWWRLRGGYTYFHKEIRNKPGHNADYYNLGLDPEHQVVLQSIMSLPYHFQLDVAGRYVDDIPGAMGVSDYLAADVRIAYVLRQFELAAVGRLFNDDHSEFAGTYIPRNFYLKLTCRL